MRCVERRLLARSVLASTLAAALLLAGCSSLTKKTGPAQPQRPVPGRTAPVAPRPVDKGDPQARFAAAVQLMREKKLPDAEAAFVALNSDFPQFSGPATNLGIIYAKSNRRDQAITAFTKATTLNERNAVAWNWLGMTQRDAGDRAAAERAYLKALQINPNYALAHLNLGILYDTYLARPQDALLQYKQYQQLARQTNGQDELRVTAWIAELEARQPAGAPPALRQSPPPLAKPGENPQGAFLPTRKP